MSLNERKLHHDLHVPLAPPSSSSTSKRRHQTHVYQMRLHQLGYHGIAFCHTAYGRLKEDKDDADVALPWKDLLPSSLSGGSDSAPGSFGRPNSLGMKVYRRLNIVVEEVSDVSRILLSKVDPTSASSVPKLLQKYDIISLQPMNEPALQNICELLSSSDVTAASPTIDANFVDVIVLEYATGSRGGYGLPYKLRKEYVVKALQTGVTFEVCYGTAVLDPKRRQGFLRSLVDFQTSYNGIQKKHMLLNNPLAQGNKRRRSEKFPLLISSGPRQNYTRGSGDAGALALRTPHDVRSLVSHLVGDNEWAQKWEDCAFQSEEVDNVGSGMPQKKSRQTRTLMSAAEKVLARANDRALGVSFTTHRHAPSPHKKRKRGWESRSHVLKRNDETGDRNESNGEASDDFSSRRGDVSLADWLLDPLRKESMDNEESAKLEHETTTEEAKFTQSNESDGGDNIPLADAASKTCEANSKDSDGSEDDVEDGFIAL